MKPKILLPMALPTVRSFLFIGAGILFAASSRMTLEQGAAYWPVLCIIVNILTISGLGIVCAFEKKPFRQLVNPNQQKIKATEIVKISTLMILVGVGGMMACSIAIYGGPPEFLIQPMPLPLAIVSLIFLPLTIVFAELPLYFGYAYNRLAELAFKPWHAGAYVIFWYALQHGFFPLLPDPKYIMFRFLSFVPLMVLIYVIYRRNNNLLPLMVGHGIMDLGTGIQILVISITA